MSTSDTVNWINSNQGLVSILLFVATVLLAWISGIFSALRRKPKFTLTLLPGPTFCATFPTGGKHDNYDVHRTAIALYLHIVNAGSAPSSIVNVAIAYHWHCVRFTRAWWSYGIVWFWVRHQAVTLQDFQYHFADSVKLYPSLFQASGLMGQSPDTYLQIGQSVNGVVYFEHEGWGACFPSNKSGHTKIRVAITDAFEKKHQRSFLVPITSLDEARKYNPSVGQSLVAVRQPPS